MGFRGQKWLFSGKYLRVVGKREPRLEANVAIRLPLIDKKGLAQESRALQRRRGCMSLRAGDRTAIIACSRPRGNRIGRLG